MRKRNGRILRWFVILTLILSSNLNISSAASKYDNMYVHYLDVGESDCILVESDDKFMLVDAGDTDDEDIIIDYLNEQNVKKLEYVICTHPHADHIGSMDAVIDEFTIGKVIMPNKTHNTGAFENLLDSIENKGLKITKPVVGKVYTIGKAEFTIIAPNDTYDDINNNSVGIKLVNGKNSFVFIGDCEKTAISDILNNSIEVNADVLMCGHHGSGTSTTKEWLNEVSPSSAVISVGNNSYGHPSDYVLDLLEDNDVKTYRTDVYGTIIAKSTGKKITFTSEKDELNQQITPTPIPASTPTPTVIADNVQDKNELIVYITKTGSKYHRYYCSYLSKSKITISLKDAKDNNYEPCSRCNPPD